MKHRELTLRFIWWQVVLCLGDWLCTKIPRRSTCGKVLVVRLDAIGDFVLWLDAAENLRSQFPSKSHELILLGNQAWTSLAQVLPCFDKVWELDRQRFVNNPLYRWRLLAKIRFSGFDIALHPTYSRDFFWGDAVVRCSGARERIGFEGRSDDLFLPKMRSMSDRWYTTLVSASDRPLMEIQRNAEFCRGIGIERAQAKVASLPECSPLPEDLAKQEYFVLVPGARKPIRRWPLSGFAEISKRIHQDTGWKGVVCGGPDEAELGEALVKHSKGALENRIGRTSLRELVTIIRHSRMIVTNDTSAVHIAAAVGTQVVCIMGGGHVGRFLPYQLEEQDGRPLPTIIIDDMPCFNCGWNCIYHVLRSEAAPCVKAVSVDAVWSQVEKIIQSH